MIYFTIIHIIFLVIYFLIFIGLLVLSMRETKKKIFWAMVFANFLVITLLSVFTMLVLDKYTKKARIENLKQKRILRTETIVFTGRIRNIGKFTIGTCVLEIKIVNDPMTSKKIGGTNVFKPTTGFNLGSKKEKVSTVSKKFIIAENLQPRELRNFSVSMPFPPYFSKASNYQYIKCR